MANPLLDELASAPGLSGMASGFTASLANNDESLENLLDELHEELNVIENQVVTHLDALRHCLDGLQDLKFELAPGDLDSTINIAELKEDQIRKEEADIRKLTKRVVRLISKKQPNYSSKLKAPTSRFDVIAKQYLSGLQEFRWQLLTYRAEASKDEAGQTHEKPSDLKKHLKSLVN